MGPQLTRQSLNRNQELNVKSDRLHIYVISTLIKHWKDKNIFQTTMVTTDLEMEDAGQEELDRLRKKYPVGIVNPNYYGHTVIVCEEVDRSSIEQVSRSYGMDYPLEIYNDMKDDDYYLENPGK